MILRFFHIVVGLGGSLLLFAWVERNMALPYLAIFLKWPWIDGGTWETWAQLIWNVLLVFLFGLQHSLLAQPSVQTFLEQRLPKLLAPGRYRQAYIVATGACAVLLIGLWQNTGKLIWIFPMSALKQLTFSLILFYGLLALAAHYASLFDPLHFLGFRSAAPVSNPSLVTTGVYSKVRHPMYLVIVLAFLCAPTMSLDRLAFTLAVLAYLTAAIPFEERKLVQVFGSAYRDYQARTPALFPRFVAQRNQNPVVIPPLT